MPLVPILALGVAGISGLTLLTRTGEQAVERQAPNFLALAALTLAAVVIWRGR